MNFGLKRADGTIRGPLNGKLFHDIAIFSSNPMKSFRNRAADKIIIGNLKPSRQRWHAKFVPPEKCAKCMKHLTDYDAAWTLAYNVPPRDVKKAMMALAEMVERDSGNPSFNERVNGLSSAHKAELIAGILIKKATPDKALKILSILPRWANCKQLLEIMPPKDVVAAMKILTERYEGNQVQYCLMVAVMAPKVPKRSVEEASGMIPQENSAGNTGPMRRILSNIWAALKIKAQKPERKKKAGDAPAAVPEIA